MVSKRGINAMHSLKIEQIKSLQKPSYIAACFKISFHTVVIENVVCIYGISYSMYGAEAIAFL